MRRERLARLLVDHLIAVAVVSADEHLSVDFLQGFDNTSYADIDCLDRLDRSCLIAGVADHIAVREVDDDGVILSALDRCYESVADLVSAHLRLKVIGRYLRGRNKETVLARVRLFLAAVEEEGYVCILLRLSGAELLQAEFAQIFAECVGDRLLLECDELVRDRDIIIREGHECRLDSLTSVKACEIVTAEYT